MLPERVVLGGSAAFGSEEVCSFPLVEDLFCVCVCVCVWYWDWNPGPHACKIAIFPAPGRCTFFTCF